MTNTSNNFFLIGLSHHKTPVELRELLATAFFDKSNAMNIADQLSAVADEYLLLSTCNRFEIIAVAQSEVDAVEIIKKILFNVLGASGYRQVEEGFYIYHNMDAARHLFRVASSLDSLVLGEPQILGQVKEAYREALKRHSVGAIISKLMHKCFRAAKRTRSETSLAAGKVSVASAAVLLASQIKGGALNGIKTVLLGAGPMAACAAGHLQKSGADVCISSRTYEKASRLAKRNNFISLPWQKINEAIAGAQLVIAATGAKEPILSFDRLGEFLKDRKNELLVIDIGVPRNVSHDLKQIECVSLRNIDDLNTVVWESRLTRQEASVKAEKIISQELESFSAWLAVLNHRPTVKALTKKAETIRLLELNRTLNQCNFSAQQQEALELMTSALVRRLLHDPLNFIKNFNRSKACANMPSSPQHCVDCPQNSSPIASLRKAFNIEGESQKQASKKVRHKGSISVK